MAIDRERNEKMRAYCDNSGRKWTERVKYQTDLSRKKTQKNTVMIIDESDERMFRDFEAFYKGTKSDKVIVICLTATAMDDSEDHLQRDALNELGYKVYYNNNKKRGVHT